MATAMATLATPAGALAFSAHRLARRPSGRPARGAARAAPARPPAPLRAPRLRCQGRAWVRRVCVGTPAQASVEGVSTKSDAGKLFGVGTEGAWDHGALGAPVVRCFLGDNEDRWYMWYNGRAGGEHAEKMDSGCIGVATSTDGFTWKRGVGAVSVTGDRVASEEGSEVGVVLTPNTEDWWTFDTLHVASGDVQVISSGAVQSEGGIYWMFYGGGDYNETEGTDGAKEVGLRMRPGLAMSQDGLNFARIEGEHYSGALFDFGKEGEWDALGVAAPQVVNIKGNMRMYYQAASSPSEPLSIGMAQSNDGFRWEKSGQVFTPGAAGTFDEAGVKRPQVVPLPPFKGGGYVMYYEGIDAAGVSSIGAARSEDGFKWERVGDGPVLAPSADGWDSGGVRTPCPVVVGGGKIRLYYAGCEDKDGPSQGVGVALSVGDELFTFERRPTDADAADN